MEVFIKENNGSEAVEFSLLWDFVDSDISSVVEQQIRTFQCDGVEFRSYYCPLRQRIDCAEEKVSDAMYAMLHDNFREDILARMPEDVTDMNGLKDYKVHLDFHLDGAVHETILSHTLRNPFRKEPGMPGPLKEVFTEPRHVCFTASQNASL